MATVYAKLKLEYGSTSFPGLQYEDEGRDEEALVWATSSPGPLRKDAKGS